MAITEQPTSKYQPLSGSTVINIPSNSPLDVLKSTERLYIRDGPCPKGINSNVKVQFEN